jgi:hypothetical protein
LEEAKRIPLFTVELQRRDTTETDGLVRAVVLRTSDNAEIDDQLSLIQVRELLMFASNGHQAYVEDCLRQLLQDGQTSIPEQSVLGAPTRFTQQDLIKHGFAPEAFEMLDSK